MKKKLISLLVVLLICVSVFGSGQKEKTSSVKEGAPGTKIYELKLSTSQPESGMITRSFQKLADALNERSGGRLKVTVYPAGQLGSDEDVLEQAIQGDNVAVNIDASRLGQYVKDLSIMMMGYFADNYDECYKVTETDVFKGWMDELEKKYGIKVFCFTFYDGPRNFMTKIPINTPADLKNLKIRTIGQLVCTESVAALGAVPVTMNPSEVYNAVETTAIDGTEIQSTSSYPFRLHEVLKYLSKTNHFQLVSGAVGGSKWFNTLPEDLQQLILDTSKEIGKETASEAIDECEMAEKAMAKEGLIITTPDLAPFKKAIEPVYEKLGFAELRKQLYEQIGKTN